MLIDEIAFLAFVMLLALVKEFAGDIWRNEILPLLPRRLRARIDPPKPLIDQNQWEHPGLLQPYWSQRIRFDSSDVTIEGAERIARFPARVQLDSGEERRVMCRISFAHLREYAEGVALHTAPANEAVSDKSVALGLLLSHLDSRPGPRRMLW